MRVYENGGRKNAGQKSRPDKLFCNSCGREFEMSGGIVKEGVISVDFKWGYFSKRDGLKHSFNLCEDCYDKIIENFKYSVTETECSEMV